MKADDNLALQLNVNKMFSQMKADGNLTLELNVSKMFSHMKADGKHLFSITLLQSSSFSLIINIVLVVDVIYVALAVGLSTGLVAWDTDVELLVSTEVGRLGDMAPVIHAIPQERDAHVLKQTKQTKH